MLLKALTDRALATGVEVRYDTSVKRLVVAQDGSVLGVEARHSGQPAFIKTPSGVALTTGSVTSSEHTPMSHARCVGWQAAPAPP